MIAYEQKDLGKPDEVREFPNGRLELVNSQSAINARIEMRCSRWRKTASRFAAASSARVIT